MPLPSDYKAGPFDSEQEFLDLVTAEESEARRHGYRVFCQRIKQDGRLFAAVTYASAAAPAAATGLLAGAAAGGAFGAVVGGPMGAAAGAAVGAVAGALAAAPSSGLGLGALSRKFEVGSRGPETVSTGQGDAGGVSYGLYQMTSASGGGTVARFVNAADFAFRDRFAGLTPGSAEFSTAWKALAAVEGKAFALAQHEFIKRTHYDVLVDAIREDTGLRVEGRSAAFCDVVWSTAVQHGPGARIVQGCIRDLAAAGGPTPETGKLYDRALIQAIYAERGRVDADGQLHYFRRNTADVQAGVAARFPRERDDALTMLA